MEKYKVKMDNMECLRKKYDELFPDDATKAKAFDEIAKQYYLGNFGTMQKSEFDVLMFSIFIEEILNRSEDDINTYSDYTLSKQLGISQGKVSSLKVRKQLKYPYDKFDWRISFKRVCENARYDGGKIKINLRDKNLYYEIKNEIDVRGGFVEGSLTTNLLVVTPEEFFYLTHFLMSEEERTAVISAIRKRYEMDEEFCKDYVDDPCGKTLVKKFGENVIDVLVDALSDLVPIPGVGTGIKILYAGLKTVKER